MMKKFVKGLTAAAAAAVLAVGMIPAIPACDGRVPYK